MMDFDYTKVPQDERETVIIIQENTARIYSSDFREIKKLDKKYRAYKEDEYGKNYRVPAKYIKYGGESNRKPLTEKQRADAAERLKDARKKKLTNT